ncbi:hypothetical protein BVX97_02515 [bacterium E08(2017)]|nr:hypothetical protein BVX97_02515 [bacterium E08(2017)]
MSQYPETADIETSSEDYASRFSGAAGKWMLSVQERIVLDLLKGHAGGTVLDVGGGHGQLARPLADKGYGVTVIGSSDDCVHRIKDYVDAGKIEFKVGNLIELPFEDNSFGSVVCIRLLPHCERWPELVREMCRVAKNVVVVDYPTGQSLNCLSGALFGAKKKIEGNTRTYRLFAHNEVKAEFSGSGWKRAALKKEFFVPMVVHRMLGCPVISKILEGVSTALGLRYLFGSPVVGKYEPLMDANKRE